MQVSGARAAQAYQTTQVQSQSPLGLVVLLYDGALRFLGAAVEAIERGDLVAKREAMSRAMAIVEQLQNTLNLAEGGEIARSLDQLYTYITGLLIEANAKRDAAPLGECIQLLNGLRDAWSTAAAECKG